MKELDVFRYLKKYRTAIISVSILAGVGRARPRLG